MRLSVNILLFLPKSAWGRTRAEEKYHNVTYAQRTSRVRLDPLVIYLSLLCNHVTATIEGSAALFAVSLRCRPGPSIEHNEIHPAWIPSECAHNSTGSWLASSCRETRNSLIRQ